MISTRLNISIGKGFYNEKKYIIDYIFDEVFGVNYDIIVSDVNEYNIEFNDKRVIISDSFFSNLNGDKEYYKKSSLIPQNVKLLNCDSLNIKQLPFFYGKNELELNEKTIIIKADLIASAFFMLSRWEEIANDIKDKHGRFPDSESLAIKHSFNLRPIVNEYIELIWQVLQILKYPIKRKEREYNLYLTHDVDDFMRYSSFGKYLKALAGDILKRKSLSCYYQTIIDYIAVSTDKKKDPYQTFSYLMNASEKIKTKSRFYFIPGKLNEYDVRFDIDNKDVRTTIDDIRNRGHIVGIHPSYESYNNYNQLNTEKTRLEKFGIKIEEGRQHYLRFENPVTWENWAKVGLHIDSTIGFYENIGFRSGTCYEYPIFDVVKSETITLRERPLLVMDTALRRVVKNDQELFDFCNEINQYVRNYNGDFVILWHNSNLMRNEWLGWDKKYLQILDIIKEDK